ncbi:MAG: hypothetical protein HOG15_11515, partial [Anaerolineae bacterium]|nr:hypothetical protein [Anaerolineae bacterium]
MNSKTSYIPKPIYWLFTLTLFIGAFAVRMIDIDDLPLDFHPTRQLFSALKARGMYYESIAPNIPEWQRDMAVQQWKTQITLEPEFLEYLTVIAYTQRGEADLALPRIITAIIWVI